MKRVLIALAFCSVSAMAAADSSSTTIKGWISDSMCGAKHAGSGGACVKKCVETGAKPVFVEDSSKQVWAIDDPKVVTPHLGHHVSIEAKADDANKSVHVLRVTMLKDQGNPAKGDEMGGASH
jgi:hypothetical protein